MDIKKKKKEKLGIHYRIKGIVKECAFYSKVQHTFVFPFEIDGWGRSARIPPPLMVMRLLMPVKDVLVDQESSVLMKLGEQLPLMMILSIRSCTVVILTNKRIDDRNPDVGGSCVIHNSSLDILYSQPKRNHEENSIGRG